MNDEDQSLRSRLSRDLHLAQRKHLIISMGEKFAKSVSLPNGDSPENHEIQNRNNGHTNKTSEMTIKSSLERYLYYIESGIPSYNIPPLSDTTLTRILQLSRSNDTEGATSQQLEEILIEIKHEGITKSKDKDCHSVRFPIFLRFREDKE